MLHTGERIGGYDFYEEEAAAAAAAKDKAAAAANKAKAAAAGAQPKVGGASEKQGGQSMAAAVGDAAGASKKDTTDADLERAVRAAAEGKVLEGCLSGKGVGGKVCVLLLAVLPVIRCLPFYRDV